MIFVANLIFFCFHSFGFLYFQNDLFSVKNAFVFEMIFVANLIFFRFHSLRFLILKWATCHCTRHRKLPPTYYQTRQSHATLIKNLDDACDNHTRSNFPTTKVASMWSRNMRSYCNGSTWAACWKLYSSHKDWLECTQFH